MKPIFRDLFATPIIKIEDFFPEDMNEFMKQHLTAKKRREAPDDITWITSYTKYKFAPQCYKDLYQKIDIAYKEYLEYWTQPDDNADCSNNSLIDMVSTPITAPDIRSCVVYQSKGSYSIPHCHANSTFTFVYYCKIPEGMEETGKLELLNPNVGSLTSIPYKFQENVTITPKERTLIGIPSYLSHWVHPTKGDDPRISIIFDVAVKKEVIIADRF